MTSIGQSCYSQASLTCIMTNVVYFINKSAVLAMLISANIYYRSRGIKLHAANSAGTLLGYGTDLDFVRPGIAMYGLPPG